MSNQHPSQLSEVLEPDLLIIDSHHHLYDRPDNRYLLDNYLADAGSGHKIAATVYVETQAMARIHGLKIIRPLGEIEFANGVGAMSDSGTYGSTRVCAGIVGYADLTAGSEIGELLDRALATAPDRLRGIRQILIDHPTEAPYRYITHRPARGIIDEPGFRSGLSQLASRGLSFDVAVLHHQLPRIAELADQFPDTGFILEHLGLPIAMSEDGDKPSDVFAAWRRNLQELAVRPNVTCKIGGFGLPFWGLDYGAGDQRPNYLQLAAAWSPYVETVVELFGPERSMLESNFPVDRRLCDYIAIWNALKHILRDYTSSEKLSLFSGTACRVYRLEFPIADSPEPAAATSSTDGLGLSGTSGRR